MEKPTPVQPRPRFRLVQMLRGLAAILVVLDHQHTVAARSFNSPRLLNLLDHGQFGVDIFFPISGFVLYLAATGALRHADTQGNFWKAFAWRRLVRNHALILDLHAP